MDEPFGAGVGSLSDPSVENLKNDFATIPDSSISDMTRSDRVNPRQIASGVLRGTQRIVNTDGSTITLGEIPETNGDFGIATFNSDNQLLYKLVGSTWLWNDLSTDKFRVSITATDDSFAMKVSQSGVDVRTATNDQLVFNSENNIFKIVRTGTFTLPALDAAGGAIDTSVTTFDTGVASATPLAATVYAVDELGAYSALPIMSTNYSGLFQLIRTLRIELSGGTVQLRVDSQNFTGMPISAVTAKYYLFQETIA